MGFSIGLRHGVQDVAAAGFVDSTQHLLLGLALAPPAADPACPERPAACYSQPGRKLCKARKSSAAE